MNRIVIVCNPANCENLQHVLHRQPPQDNQRHQSMYEGVYYDGSNMYEIIDTLY